MAEDSSYSYTATPNPAGCQADKHTSGLQKAYVTGYERYQGDTSLRVRVSRAPVIALVAVDSSFMMYQAGVYKDPAGCMGAINHAVSVVGYGKSGRDMLFWKLKNSWGEGWGEGGYMRLTRDVANHCSIS